VIKVFAKDNSPSALLSNGEHNKGMFLLIVISVQGLQKVIFVGQQNFHIIIGDTNDNPPRFTKKTYVAEAVEDANLHALVTEVRAIDNDTASEVTYSIESGNPDDTFVIEKNTGKIRVNKKLDYESRTSVRMFLFYLCEF